MGGGFQTLTSLPPPFPSRNGCEGSRVHSATRTIYYTVMSDKTKEKIALQRLELRRQLWPSLVDAHYWTRKQGRKGFTTIPRTMPLLIQIMDSLSKNKPLSSVYLELWCRSFDEFVITLNKPQEMAFFAGFSGQRAVQTWSERIKILANLGFIVVAQGPSGPLSYAAIPNPYLVVAHYASIGKVEEDLLNSLRQRTIEIGATDIQLPPSPPPPPLPPKDIA